MESIHERALKIIHGPVDTVGYIDLRKQADQPELRGMRETYRPICLNCLWPNPRSR